MTEKNAKPQLRFAGFDDTWEQRKAVDIADYSKGNGYSKSDLTENGTPIILYGRLYTKYQFAIDEVDTFATPKDGSIYSQGNEVIIPASGETAEDIARASAVEKSGILLGGDLNILRPFNFINPLFLALTISNGEPQKELAKKAQGKSVVHIHNSDIQEVTVSFPTRAEQDRIVAVFRSLDNLITLHQRKYDKLTNVKKSMLEKMFPKNGSNVPEIRFKGFSDAWEQRKAVDIADYSKGNGYSKSDLTENGTPIILYGRLYTKYQFAIDEVDTFATPKDGSIYSQGNEVIIPASGETAEDIARASAVEKSGILLGGDLNILRPFNFINPLFLALTISNGEPQKELAKKAQGKSVVHIHNSDIQEVTVSFPTRAEQDRIVAVFRSLDNLITLHQRELEKLKNLKKACLEKMFV
ncbi:restriction endonuclease subunit S [Oliverpabstia intestinalis]|uniref:restriction endonuclease subunit S n=1 Tax=Oliverpabstia intestinalis TaxID=2606633 RepID=UPI003F9BAAE1